MDTSTGRLGEIIKDDQSMMDMHNIRFQEDMIIYQINT